MSKTSSDNELTVIQHIFHAMHCDTCGIIDNRCGTMVSNEGPLMMRVDSSWCNQSACVCIGVS